MPDVIGIRFKSCGKIYDFEIEGIDVNSGDTVIVESELGLSLGKVVTQKRAVESSAKELKKVLRKADEGDFDRKRENETLESEARAYCLERIMARGLPMKLICAEATLDKKRIVFYFAAEGRIDFRELVKDLAAKFKTRIEMRQVGVRDEAKMLGGLGICGRELCCRKFLTTFEPISIRMAKSQELVLNANKLSGVCGRLMCCIGYEYIEDDVSRTGGADKEVQADFPEDAISPREGHAGDADTEYVKYGHTKAVPVESRKSEIVSGHNGIEAKTERKESQDNPGGPAKEAGGGEKRFRRRRRRHRKRPAK